MPSSFKEHISQIIINKKRVKSLSCKEVESHLSYKILKNFFLRSSDNKIAETIAYSIASLGYDTYRFNLVLLSLEKDTILSQLEDFNRIKKLFHMYEIDFIRLMQNYK